MTVTRKEATGAGGLGVGLRETTGKQKSTVTPGQRQSDTKHVGSQLKEDYNVPHCRSLVMKPKEHVRMYFKLWGSWGRGRRSGGKVSQ